MITGREFAEQAQSEKYTGVPYSKLDCQAFVEEVLKDCGVRKPDGTIYNWKGSNSMWRNALAWKGTITDCYKTYGCIPLGAWTFIVKDDGGEKLRGYNDNKGNASHVGIYCNCTDMGVRDSTKSNTRNGVGYRKLEGFTHIGIPKMINFDEETVNEKEALKAVKTIRQNSSSDSEILSALKILFDFLKVN